MRDRAGRGTRSGLRARVGTMWPVLGWSLAGITGLSPPLLGAEPEAQNPPEEIIVHARRREEKIEDAPVAVTAISGAELSQASAVLYEDLGREVPNMRMVSDPRSVSSLAVTLRGQTTVSSSIVYDPAVGIYVDGVYVANAQGAMGTLLDIESVEVVRGVQGTLFGRNTTGGAISLRTHRPDFDSYEAEVALGGGNYSQFLGRAILNLPLADHLAVRLAFQSNEHQGFGESIASGQTNFANQHRWQGRFSALWAPNSAWSAYFTYEHMSANEVGAILHPLPDTQVQALGQLTAQFPQFGLPPVTVPANFYNTDADYHAFDWANNDLTQLTIDGALSASVAAKLIVGYRHLNASTALDVDATALPLANTTLGNTSNQKSAELQLSGTTAGLPLDWVGGLYWFRDDGSAPSRLEPYTPQYLAFVNFYNANVAPPLGAPPLPVQPYPVLEQNSVTNISRAAYLHGEYHLTERWAVAAGVRRTEDTRELDENDFALTPGGEVCTISTSPTDPTPAGNGGPCPPIHKSVNFGYWSYELATRYRFNDALTGYLRTGRGQRSGGWNAPLATLEDQPFRPEQLTDYEAGLKADLLGGRLRTNGALFYGQYDDMQRLLAQEINGTPTTYVINAGRARVSGVELEGIAQIAAPLSVRASFGYTDAAYQTFSYSFAGVPVDLSGNQFYQTPKFTAALAAAYETEIPVGRFGARFDYAWQDAVQFNVINDGNLQAGYGTLNGRLWLSSQSSSWQVALFGTNITDRQFAYTGGSLGVVPPQVAMVPPQIAWQIPGARRLVGVEGIYRMSRPR